LPEDELKDASARQVARMGIVDPGLLMEFAKGVQQDTGGIVEQSSIDARC
jgi:hypothetical protein